MSNYFYEGSWAQIAECDELLEDVLALHFERGFTDGIRRGWASWQEVYHAYGRRGRCLCDSKAFPANLKWTKRCRTPPARLWAERQPSHVLGWPMYGEE